MKFKFAGTQKIDNSGKGCFMYKGVNLMEYQYQWKDIDDEYTRLKMKIGEEDTVFKPYVYQLKVDNKVLIFASGEITNGIWGFALPDE